MSRLARIDCRPRQRMQSSSSAWLAVKTNDPVRDPVLNVSEERNIKTNQLTLGK